MISKAKNINSEDHYYFKFGTVSALKPLSSGSTSVQRSTNILFQHPSFLKVNRMVRQSKGRHSLDESLDIVPQFYKVQAQKTLSDTDLKNAMTISCSLQVDVAVKTQGTFKFELQNFIKQQQNKQNFLSRHVLTSVDQNYIIDVIIIPSINQLTIEILQKIVEHEDSKLTKSSLSGLQNLPTQESLGHIERNSKFKRTLRENPLKIQKKTRKNEKELTISGFKPYKFDKFAADPPIVLDSPVKRSLQMRRSHLIPRKMTCEMEQTDQNQSMRFFQKHASNGMYILGLVLQLIIIFQLMTPSSKV